MEQKWYKLTSPESEVSMLLARIELYLRRTKHSPSRFGRDAVGDPHFVPSLRRGRRPRASTTRRVLAFIRARERELAAAEARR